MAKEYIERRDGNYYVAATRISLDSIVHAFRRGESPETICQNFELLGLEEVYGAIAYYLANQADIDAYLTAQSDKWAEGKRNAEPLPANLRDSRGLGKRCTRAGCREGSISRGCRSQRAIVSGVLRREPSVDFLTAKAAGLRGMRDLDVLTLAAERQRVLVSHDAGTMPAHFHAFRNAGKHSSGVFLIHQKLDVGTAVDELLLIWIASEASEWENRLEWLPL